jgi:hypothetical protein
MLDHKARQSEWGAPGERGLREAGPDEADMAPSGRRRRLLKAAASAAPLIATLPSGEALASASALQCVISEQNGDKSQPQGEEPETVPPRDNYARLSGRVEQWLVEDPSAPTERTDAIVYYMVIDGEDIRVWGENGAGFPEPGTWFDPVSANAFPPVAVDDFPAEFLYLYQANTAPLATKSDLEVDAATILPAGCTIKSGISWPGPGGTPATPSGPSAPEHCVFPMAVQANVGAAGNVPLTYSCLASFQNAL